MNPQTLDHKHIISGITNYESMKHNKHMNTRFTWKTQLGNNHYDNQTHNINKIYYCNYTFSKP